MVKSKDIVLFLSVALASSIILFGTGIVDLPGSTTFKDIIGDPSVEPEDKYKLVSEATFNTDGIADNTFKYKTEKASSFLSLADSGISLNIIGAREVEAEYVLKDSNGKVVASGSKFLGKIEAFEKKTATFETNNLVSGSYKVEYIARYEKCGLLGCSDQTDTLSKTVEVPKLPLGEY